ncbi:MAG: CRTAC1 family protein [Pirellulaceae bacterium]
MAQRKLSKRYRLMLRWGIPSGLATLVLGFLAWTGSVRVDPSAIGKDGKVGGLTSVLEREIAPEMVRFTFADATHEAGFDFHHFPATRQSLLPEDMGSGLAWGDYDNDGDHDLFLVNFRSSIVASEASAAESGRCALYRNDGDGRFTDVAEDAGVDCSIYGMAAAWGDCDSDGDLDLYITAYGPNILYRNEGNSRFTDISQIAGVDDERFSAGCAWGDFDRDGRIDLYVTTYVNFQYSDEDLARVKQIKGEVNPYTINPSSFAADTNVLYHNNGDGTFTDIAQQAGVADPEGRSLGAIWFDFDNDQWLDLYVANDVSANGVFLNNGDSTFSDIGAVSLAADYRGAMGLAVCDYGDDGDFDLFVTHWIAQENAFFLNNSLAAPPSGGRGLVMFADRADAVGLGQVSLSTVGWGTGFVDFDNDSHLDLWVVNGSTLQDHADATALVPQRPHVFRQQDGKGFFETGVQACSRLGEPIVGRGGAHADYDGDGKMDLAIMSYGGQPVLLHNTTPAPGHWIGVRLRQTTGNTFGLGAVVVVRTKDRVQTAIVGAEGSYLSQSPSDLHFGVGDAEIVDSITVRWPDGTEETVTDVDVDRVLSVSHELDANR